MAQTYTLSSNGTGGGDWSVASSWAENRVPACGDIMLIQSGDLIDIDGQQNYSESFCPGDYMYLLIEGTLDFSSNGPKLRFPCSGSTIEVGVGGSIIRTANGGGQNNYIDICSDIVWTGNDPDITDPIILTGPLPIELISFNLKQRGESCQITWVTGSEVNNDFFTVERSRNLSFWEVIAYVDGAGNSSHTIEYAHLDEHPWSGVSYYRLRQTDFDGAYMTFNVQSLQFAEDVEVMLYPNPANEYMVISGQNVEHVEVIDALGRVHSISPSNTSDTQQQYDVSNLPDGVYHLEISGKATTESQTLYILH